MKTATLAAKNMVRNNVAIKALPKLIAEWEHNRFSPIESIEVTPAQANDLEWLSIYDLDSVGLPARPAAGIAKARVGSNTLPLATTYRDSPTASRYYISTDEDPYRYWSSTQKTNTGLVSEGFAFSTPVVLTLLYEDLVYANKLAVGFETSYARPQDYKIEVTVDGTSWTNVQASALDVSGRVIMWRDTDGNWSDSASYAGAIQLKGIRLTVYALNRASQHLDVLQMGLRLEHDLTAYVEEYSKSLEISERNFIAPLGRSSSNVASVTLNNIDQRFNNDNESSPYYGLLGKKVRMTLDLSLDVSGSGGSSDEKSREFTMWTDTWGGQEQTSCSIELKDSSVILQETKLPNVFWENTTVGAIIWQIMDILGLTNYNYTRSVQDTTQVVPYFWPDDNSTGWEMISSLSEGTQTAVYFDEYDILQIKSHRAIFSDAETIDWNLDAVPNGAKLADIITPEVEEELVANRVNIDYRPAKYSEWNNGLPKMETVWEPEESTVTLRAATLVKDLLVAGTQLWIKQSDAQHWPYESLVNIRGEILKYKGKEYVRYKVGGGTETKIVYNFEEKQDIDETSDPVNAWKNYFTGKFLVTERGLYGSGVVNHKIKQDSNYSSAITTYRNTTLYAWNSGYVQKDGYLQVTNLPTGDGSTYHLMRHGTAVIAPYVVYGARIRFPRGGRQAAGLWFDGNSLDIGYYLELMTTEQTDVYEKRQWRNEVSLTVEVNNLVSMKAVPGGEGTKGFRASIVPGQWYDLMVVWKKSTGGSNPETIAAYINGVYVGTWIVAAANRPITDEGRWGFYVRDKSQVDFEYAFATGTQTAPAPDTSTFLDWVTGSFTSGYIQRDWKYGTRYFNAYFKGRYYPQMISRSDYAYDEFGPVVHEMREYDVKFDSDSVPVRHSSLYLSNTSQIAVLNYMSDPFGAKFMLANASRSNAIAQGEDTLTFGADNTVNQKMFIYGRSMYQEEDMNILKEDLPSIRRNGVTDLSFESRFIQTESMAEDLAQWVVDIWGGGVDELRVEIFGNPFLQLGDLVTMNDPLKNMIPTTHKYFVVGISNTFRQGLETTLILRRARL